MISFKCECGKIMKVDDRMADKLGRCPKCGKTIRIPGGPPPAEPVKPLRPARSSPPAGSADHASALGALAAAASTRQGAGPPPASPGPTAGIQSRSQEQAAATIGIVAGFLLLGTIFIPWSGSETTIVMSWTLVADAPGVINAFLIGAWVIGLASIFVSIFLRGSSMSYFQAALGLLGVILFLVVVEEAMDAAALGPYPYRTSHVVVLGSMVVLLWIAAIVVGNVRLRIGPKPVVRVFQGLCGAGLAVLMAVTFFRTIAAFSDLPKPVKETLVFDLILHIALQLSVIVAGAMVASHAASGKIGRYNFTRAGLHVLYSSLVVLGIYLLVRPAVLAESGWLALSFLNSILLISSIGMLFCVGAVGSASGVSAAVARLPQTLEAAVTHEAPAPSPAPAAPGTVEARLAATARMFEQGMLTEEEYAQAKRKILTDV